MKERSRRVIETGVGVGAMAVLMTVSFFAFKRNIRHEIGTRDGWVCQKPGCDDGTGIAKSFDNGYMQYISHIKTHDKKHPDYNKPETGRAHCIQCEIDFHSDLLMEAVEQGNTGQVKFNESALKKLSRVDHRTYDYRDDPERFEAKWQERSENPQPQVTPELRKKMIESLTSKVRRVV